MGSKRFVPVILFIGLLLGGSYYYLCEIKQVCDGMFGNLTTSVNGSQDTLQDGLMPLSFRFNSAEPIVGADFETYRESLIGKLGPIDTLVVNALYFKNETNGSTLAQDRAENVRSLLADYFDESRLQVHTDFDGITRADDQSSLEAVKFSVVSGDMYADNSSDEQPADDAGETDELNQSDVVESTEPTQQAGQWNETLTIYFPKGSIRKRITPEVAATIDQIVSQMAINPDLKIYVEGHTNDEGNTEEENYQLGRRRAWVIKKLIWDKGVDPMRIITSSQGSLAPVNTNDTEVDKAYNRRVEVTVK